MEEFAYSCDKEELICMLQECIREYGLEQSKKALPFALEMHRGQKRKEGIPYIVHPMTVACHCLAAGLCEDEVIAAALLHDVCEDCPVTPRELPVNEKTQRIVAYLTYDRRPEEDKTAAHRRYYRNMRECREACIIKLFDRCHNISSMPGIFLGAKLRAYIDETREYIIPLIEYTRGKYPELRPAVFLLEYQIRSILLTAESGLA